MASLRTRSRSDGSTYHAVLYRLHGKQTSTSFQDYGSAARFHDLVDKVGPAKALEATVGADAVLSAMTVEEWLEHHIDHLTGLAKSTLADYRAYAKNDIKPVLGPIPLTALSRDDIAQWMQAMADQGASGKTIANKHGFLSSALNAAVRAGRIGSNPAAGQQCRGPSGPTWSVSPVMSSRAARRRHRALATAGRVPGRLRLPLGRGHGAASVRRRPRSGHRPHHAGLEAHLRQGRLRTRPPKTKRSIRTDQRAQAGTGQARLHRRVAVHQPADRPVRHNGFHERVWGRRPCGPVRAWTRVLGCMTFGTPARVGWWLLGCRCRWCRRTSAMSRSTPRSRSTATSTGAAGSRGDAIAAALASGLVG